MVIAGQLFDVDNPDDVQVLSGGPFELRVLDGPNPQALSLIHESFQEFFCATCPEEVRAEVIRHCAPSVQEKVSAAAGETDVVAGDEPPPADKKCVVMEPTFHDGVCGSIYCWEW